MTDTTVLTDAVGAVDAPWAEVVVVAAPFAVEDMCVCAWLKKGI